MVESLEKITREGSEKQLEEKEKSEGYGKFGWKEYVLIGATITAIALGYLVYCIKSVESQVPEQAGKTIVSLIEPLGDLK